MKKIMNEDSKIKKNEDNYYFLKRSFDIIFSLITIIILFPFMIIVGIIIKITSNGPIIYVSDRVGQNGVIFKFYKFRSMRVDAEKYLEELLDKNEIKGGVTFKMKNDPRITKFGKFLRKTSIDELPQLFNILKGDMSFVGPRPCTVREYNLYNDFQKKRLVIPQGLTGEWQVYGRSNTTFDEMINLDMRYIERRSFLYDLKLIFKTFFVVFQKRGAE